MFRASLYIVVCSARNHLRVRLRRLREPRYLFGAIAGIAYLYFSGFARFRGSQAAEARRRGRAPGPETFASVLQQVGSLLGGLGVFALAAVAWVWPSRSGLIEFTKAETAFLLPAPVSRRQLLMHRLLRSQLGALVGAILIAIVFRSASDLGRIRVAFSVWILFVTMRVYYAGVTLARSSLALKTARVRLAAWVPVVAILGVLAIIGKAVVGEFGPVPPPSAANFAERLGRALTSGLPQVVLWPFVAVARPLLASGTGPFLGAVAGALAVLVAVTLWTLSSDEAFEVAASEAAERRAAQPRGPKSMPRVRPVGWTLGLSGRVEGLFVWKNAMSMLRASNVRVLRWVGPILGVSVGVTSAIMAANRLRGAAGLACSVSLAVVAFALLVGPQVARADLRDDLENLDLLKTWPVGAAALIRGEMLWPALVVSAFGWLGIASAAIFAGTAFPRVPGAWRWSIAAAAALGVPALVAAQYTIHNAVAVLLPAWVPIGNQRPRGVDALGQRLILLVGAALALVVMALPGALAGGIVWFALRRILGAAALVPGAMLFAGVALIEVLLVTEMLGPAYERIDILSVERTE